MMSELIKVLRTALGTDNMEQGPTHLEFIGRALAPVTKINGYAEPGITIAGGLEAIANSVQELASSADDGLHLLADSVQDVARGLNNVATAIRKRGE